jgi:hypothetical protein
MAYESWCKHDKSYTLCTVGLQHLSGAFTYAARLVGAALGPHTCAKTFTASNKKLNPAANTGALRETVCCGSNAMRADF